MASIERTAYPQFPRTLTLRDLQTSFSPRPEEAEWALGFSRSPDRRLALLVQLKSFQFMRHFPPLDTIPREVVEHIAATLAMPPAQEITYSSGTKALYRHHRAIRTLLGVKSYTDAQTGPLAIRLARSAAEVVDTRTDIINIAIEELIRLGYELPAFRTLDEIAEQAHTEAEVLLSERVAARLAQGQRDWLD